MLQSNYARLCDVTFPQYAARQHYMHSCDAGEPSMPPGFEDYVPVVTRLLRAASVGAGRKVHITVDEKIVAPGMSQRRPGPHVDGCFSPVKNKWGGGGGGGWLHTCNDLGIDYPFRRMAIIVAASVPGCRAWKGTFAGEPKDDGDLSHIRAQMDEGEVLPASTGFLLSPDCVHESMVYDAPTQRQFLRIAFRPE